MVPSRVEDESTETATSSTEELFEELQGNLRAMAERLMVHERGDHTQQATALVHEVYLRLGRQEEAAWKERGQFRPDHAPGPLRPCPGKAHPAPRERRANHGAVGR